MQKITIKNIPPYITIPKQKREFSFGEFMKIIAQPPNTKKSQHVNTTLLIWCIKKDIPPNKYYDHLLLKQYLSFS